MNKNNLASWFFEGGAISIPKRLIGLSETIGLDHKDLGQITYLLYCDNKISKDDKFSMNAVRALKRRGFVNLDESGDFFQINFDPLFEIIEEKLGLNDSEAKENKEITPTADDNYSETLKKIESELAIFLTVREKMELQEVVQQYLWNYDLVGEMFINYHKNFKRQYPFKFYCKMAYGNNVADVSSLKDFQENINYLDYKIVEVKKRLGHRRNYSEVEKETYLKWINLWKFSHEMVLLAVEQTLSAKDPTFKYLDKILENWHKDSIKTREDFLRKEKEFEKTKVKTQTPGKKDFDDKKVLDKGVRNLNRFSE